MVPPRGRCLSADSLPSSLGEIGAFSIIPRSRSCHGITATRSGRQGRSGRRPCEAQRSTLARASMAVCSTAGRIDGRSPKTEEPALRADNFHNRARVYPHPPLSTTGNYRILSIIGLGTKVLVPSGTKVLADSVPKCSWISPCIHMVCGKAGGLKGAWLAPV